jgi:riboflavin synthase
LEFFETGALVTGALETFLSMFTGLIEEVGSVKEIRKGSSSAFLAVKAAKVLKDIKVGDSISVNGACLTVKAINSDSFSVDIISETLEKTNLAVLGVGDEVNLERAMRLSERLGGHLLSGHIDEVGTIDGKNGAKDNFVLRIGVSQKIIKYIVPQGSIAVDGVSLTVVDCDRCNFTVAIIPHTAQATTLGARKIRDMVNLEADLIAKYVEKLLGKRDGISNITNDFLIKLGYQIKEV